MTHNCPVSILLRVAGQLHFPAPQASVGQSRAWRLLSSSLLLLLSLPGFFRFQCQCVLG